MTQMVKRCFRGWRRLPRATPISRRVSSFSSDSSQGTSAHLSSLSGSDQESWWQDTRRGLKRLGKDHSLSGVMWFQLDDHGLSTTGHYRLEVHQKSVPESQELIRQIREDPHNSKYGEV